MEKDNISDFDQLNNLVDKYKSAKDIPEVELNNLGYTRTTGGLIKKVVTDKILDLAVKSIYRDIDNNIKDMNGLIGSIESYAVEMDQYLRSEEQTYPSAELLVEQAPFIEDFKANLKDLSAMVFKGNKPFKEFAYEAMVVDYFSSIHPESIHHEVIPDESFKPKYPNHTDVYNMSSSFESIIDDDCVEIENHKNLFVSEMENIKQQSYSRAMDFLSSDLVHGKEEDIAYFIRQVEDLSAGSQGYYGLSESQEKNLVNKLKSMGINTHQDFNIHMLSNYITMGDKNLDIDIIKEDIASLNQMGELLAYLTEMKNGQLEGVSVTQKQSERINTLINVLSVKLKIEESRLLKIQNLEQRYIDTYNKIFALKKNIDDLYYDTVLETEEDAKLYLLKKASQNLNR